MVCKGVCNHMHFHYCDTEGSARAVCDERSEVTTDTYHFLCCFCFCFCCSCFCFCFCFVCCIYFFCFFVASWLNDCCLFIEKKREPQVGSLFYCLEIYFNFRRFKAVVNSSKLFACWFSFGCYFHNNANTYFFAY